MTHLGDRVTDLVDGQLGPEATERAHAHLARCMPCREAVEAERLMKSRLASLPAPPPSGDLVGRLLAIGAAVGEDRAPVGDPGAGPGEPGDRVVRAAQPGSASGFPDTSPAHGPGSGRAGSPAAGRPARSRPPGARPAGRPYAGRSRGARPRQTRRRLAVAVFGALSVVGVGAAGLTLAPGSLIPGTVVPPVATFVVEHTATTRDLPFVDVPGGWFGDDAQARN